MRIDLVYQVVLNDLGKARNGMYPVSQFNLDAYRASLVVFNKYDADYSESQVLHDALAPFKASFVFTPSTSANGTITLPPDYAHLLAGNNFLFDNSTGSNILSDIRVVNEDELSSALKSQVRPVSNINRIAVGNASNIQLYPAIPATGELNYLRLPKKPVYNYTISGRTPVYNPTGSQDIEFTDVYLPEVIEQILVFANRFLNTTGGQ